MMTIQFSNKMSSKPTGLVFGPAAKQLKELQSRASKSESQKPLSPDVSPKPDFKLDWTDELVTKEEVFMAYINFLKDFPLFIKSEKEKIIQNVREKLKIGHIEKSLESLNFDKLINKKDGNFIIEKLSSKLGQSLR